MQRLYRQVYLYTVAVVMMSMLLATGVAGLVFNRREQGLIKQIIRSQVVFIRQEVQKVQRTDPRRLPQRLAELSKQLSWDMAYWYDGQLLYSSVANPPPVQELRTTRQLRSRTFWWTHRNGHQTAIALRVFPRSRKGLLWLEPRWGAVGKGLLKGPLLGLTLLLVFLGLLLIPLTRFLLRPYRELQWSIERLSGGNFHEEIEPEKYKAFAPLLMSFNQMQQHVQGMIQQKQRLVADVSHELRSPLTRMRVALEILRTKNDPKLIEQAIQEIEELDHIIEDVLEVSRLQLKGLQLAYEPVDLTLFFFELLEDYELSFEKHDFSLEVQMPEESLWLHADPRLLKRLFSNLLSNALKYVPGPATLSLSLSKQSEQVYIQLQDTGPGIAPDHLKHIFTPFYRLEDSRHRNKGGVGLGLAIAYEIVQAHGGHIRLTNKTAPHTGLIYDIELPIDRP